MSYNQLKKKTDGFTIIEVLIVLAIAGLIMLVVFLAVPALQRNSRNTQAKNEAAALLGAVSEYVSNNNGKLPTASTSTTASSAAEQVFNNAKLQNITTLVVEAETGTAAPSSTQAVLRLAAKCPATAGTTNTQPGAGRQIALLYVTESSSGSVNSCTES